MAVLKRKEDAPPEPEKRSRVRFVKRREPEPPPEPEKKRPGKRTVALAVAGLAGAVMFWKTRSGGDDGADADD